MRVAALDLGTNTFLCLIAEVEPEDSKAKFGRIRKVLHDEVRVIRLGQGVNQNRRFHPEALARAEVAFKEFSQVIRQLGAKRTLAIATSAARDVQNGNELIELGGKYGIPIEIVSGEREAELTFQGTIESPEAARIIDVGGGSTEFIEGGLASGQPTLLSRVSVDVGSVRLTEKFVTRHPIPPIEMQQMRSYIERELENADVGRLADPSAKVIAVAGTPTTLATLEQGLAFESERVNGFDLTTARLQYWVEHLASLSVEERQKLAGMEPKRADVIVAGALILQIAAAKLGDQRLQVSTRGLRYGVARSLV